MGMPAGPERAGATVLRDEEPDPRRAGVGRCPDEKDLAHLKACEGKPKCQVIKLLGHPSAVRHGQDGKDVWDYPWVACCAVTFKNGICVETYCTGGY